jgi:hypothetical protein
MRILLNTIILRQRSPRRLPSFVVLGLCAVVQACVYLPRTTQVFDAECQVMVNHMVLEGGQVAAIQHCQNQGCVALIVGASVVTAATVIVSGTIVVAGNVAYWFERKARCGAGSFHSREPTADIKRRAATPGAFLTEHIAKPGSGPIWVS